MFFLAAFLDLIFLHFMLNFAQKCDFWIPFGIRWGPTWRPKSPKWRQNAYPKTPAVLPKCGPETDLRQTLIFPPFWRSWFPFWSFWTEFRRNSDENWHHLPRFPAALSRAISSQPLSKQTSRASRNCRNTTPQQTKRWQHNRHPQLAPSKTPAAATNARSPK